MLETWNDALDELETNLAQPVDVAHLARIALVSEYHFRRMFSTLVGMGVSEYVKRRRMTLAAADVRAGDEQLIDIALRYGYVHADSFARAFKDVHGVTPSEARVPATPLRSQPRVQLRITIDGRTDMSHRIIELDAFGLIGRSARLPLVHHGSNAALTEFVASIPVEETLALKARNDVEPCGVLAVCTDFADEREDGREFTYLHGVATSDVNEADGLDVIHVSAGQWLVLEPADPSDEALQALWPYAFTEWFATNPYELAPGPEIVAMQRSESGGLERALWLPITPRV